MQHRVRLFVLKGDVPTPAEDFVVDTESVDKARIAARARLEADGYRIRALTFGPTGLLAYVGERAP